jgi:hypothetical protein
MGERMSVLGRAPWWRAPRLLRRSPAVLLAVVAAGLILAAAAAATRLFLTSAANAALARQMEERCPPTYGFQVRSTGPSAGRSAPRRRGTRPGSAAPGPGRPAGSCWPSVSGPSARPAR